MRFFSFIFIIFFFSTTAFSQKIIKHKVKEGESISVIAKKYNVSENEIYELNPKTKGAILSLKTVLAIPNKKYKSKKEEKKSEKNTKTHEVKAGESLYKIALKYKIPLEELKDLNPTLDHESIKIGTILVLKATKEPKEKTKKEIETKTTVASIEQKPIPIDTTSLIVTEETENNPEDEIGNTIHIVKKGETLHKIAKKYKVKLQTLKEQNEEVIDLLPIGYHVIIKLGNKEVIVKQQEIADQKPILADTLSLENLSKADYLIAKACSNIGTRYRSGGTSRAGFDCSGLIYSTFKNIAITLPRSSGSMAVGAGIRVDRSNAQKGDLIFFTTNGRGSVNHVGMITEVLENEIKFVHSSVQSGVIISSTREPYYARRFVQINRVLSNQ